MASPQSTTSGDAAVKDKDTNLEQITFRFCSECSNMLYPKEDEDAHKLMFTCRTCLYTEEATSSCVFRHVLNNAVGETAGVTQDVGSDPTVCGPVSSSCSDVTVTASPATSAAVPTAAEDADFNPALCLRCGFVLLQCSRCEDPASIDEYNKHVLQSGDFSVEQSLRYVQLANHWGAIDEDAQADFEERFSTFDELVVPQLSGLPGPLHPTADSITAYLPYEWTLDSDDADPPEALGSEPSMNDCDLLD